MTDAPSVDCASPAPAPPRSRRGRSAWLPLLLLVLALGDLRIDLQLLLDHFTFTTLLMAQPSLWRRYRSHH
ncbi:MAG: hypothetical protein ACKO0M_00505 [Cyanobium sp.]